MYSSFRDANLTTKLFVKTVLLIEVGTITKPPISSVDA